MTEISRRNLLRSAGLVGGGLLAAPLLSSCSKDSPPAAETAGGPVTVDFWTHDPGYVNTFKASVATNNSTKATKFTYTMKVTSLAADAVVTKLIAQAQAKKGTPDFAGVEVSQFPRMMRQNIAPSVLVDWTAQLSDEEKGNLLRLNDYAVDGKTYALESDTCPVVLYYREDLFKKYGIPTDLETWDDLKAAGAKSGKSFGIACNGTAGDAMGMFRQLYQQRGMNLFDKDGKPTIDTPEAVETIQFIADSVKSGFFTVVADPYGAPNAAALKSEKLIATFMPDWYNFYVLQANVPTQKGKWRIRTLPKFASGGVGAALGGTGMAVVKDKPNTQAAIDLVRYTYLTKEGQLLRFKKGGYLPTMKSLYEDKDFTTFKDAYLGGQEVFPIYQSVANAAPPFYQSPNLTVLIDVLGGQIQKAQTGSISASEAIKNAQAAYTSQAK
jgi:arabinosaccharide transport system substrate-binding protein